MRERVVLTRFVRDWVERSQQPQVLHVFERACNLINERDEIISIVWPELGAGPFSIVLGEKWPFSSVTLDTKVNITHGCLTMAALHIDLRDTILWQPHPNWEAIQQNRFLLSGIFPSLEQILREQEFSKAPSVGVSRRLAPTMYNQFQSGKQELLAGLQKNDFAQVARGAERLAGLGQGLTPAGDDFLVGAIIALWAMGTHSDVIELIVQTAVPRTTKLSAAWLCAAGRGELVEPWHDFFAGLDGGKWETAVSHILQIGHSSGYDALMGFTAVTKIFIQGV